MSWEDEKKFKDKFESTALNSEEQSKLQNHFNKNNPNDERGCHICGHTSWVSMPVIYTPIIFDRKRNCHTSDSLHPVVGVMCEKCGVVSFFDARTVGINHLLSEKKEENK